MRIMTFGYVPPPTFKGARSFYENVRHYDTGYPMTLFSDHGWPDTVRIHSPENFKMKDRPFAISNALFFTAIRIAMVHEFKPTHMIYLESDCRVGAHGWDDTMVKEFQHHSTALMGGSMVIWSPCNYDMKFLRLWEQTITDNNQIRNFPIPTYSVGGAKAHLDPCVFINGALGIYDIEMLKEAFDVSTTKTLVAHATAWDMDVGHHLFKKYEHDVFAKVAHLNCVYSGYGNTLTTEEERQQMLVNGDVVGVHQIKSNWKGIPDAT